MKRLLPVLLLGVSSVLSAEEAAPADLLRFTNGNRLDGRFTGLKPGPTVSWKRDDMGAPVEFKVNQLRQVVLRGGRPAKPFPDLSSVGLVNGDRIPGTVVSMDAHNVTVDTVFSGPLVIPRPSVSMLSPNPLGGKILYSGPFSDEGWSIVSPPESEIPAAQPPPDTGKDALPPNTPPWSYANGSWYYRQSAAALVRKTGMPERALVRFQLAWKSRLSLAIAFHGDLKEPPKPADGENKGSTFGVSGYPRMFGNSYVMNLYPNYVILYRCGYEADGKPIVERIQAGGTNIRLPETGEATVELRCNRQTGEIVLYLNDEFAVQWNEGAGIADTGYAGRGGALGFQVQGPGSPVRISDLVIAEWNGMPDAARSLQTQDQDIVLLSNGTDRFSGEVIGASDGKLQLKGRYGDFEFPLPEISEVRFARNRLAKPTEAPNDQIHVRFHPFGRFSGAASDGPQGSLSLTSPITGASRINLDYAVMLDFKNSNSFLDDWDPQF